LYADKIVVTGAHNFTCQELLDVMQLVRGGRLRPIVSRIFPLQQVEQAHALLRDGGIVGRAVLQVS
jgi:D-arabinose 1-dehydrogenase-like Zn-dependent alcohol dehydrogenase